MKGPCALCGRERLLVAQVCGRCAEGKGCDRDRIDPLDFANGTHRRKQPTFSKKYSRGGCARPTETMASKNARRRDADR